MAWSAIAAAERDPESPLTTGLMGKYHDRDQALFDGRAMVIKTALETDNTGVMQNDDELFFAVSANQIWHFEMAILITTDGAVPDFQFDFTFPVGTTYLLTWQEEQIVPYAGYVTEASGASTLNFLAGVTGIPLWFHGWIDTAGAGGTFQFQWARSGGAGNTSVLAGSYLAAHQDYSTI